MIKLNNTTYKNIVKDNPKDLVEVIYGDDKDLTKFQPQQKIQRWDNECNVSIRLIEDKDELKETATIIEENGKIKHIKSKRECHFYNLGVSEEYPENAQEFEVILKEDPREKKGIDYTIEFSMEDKNVEYAYQGFISEMFKNGYSNYFDKEIIVDGLQVKDSSGNVLLTRKEKIEGSYAVYAKEKKLNYEGGKEYKANKIGNIYRPKYIDKNGKEIFGTINISNGILQVTVPSEFMDNATYPIKHAAGLTFGDETTSGTGVNAAFNGMRGSHATPASAGSVTKMSAYVNCVYSSNIKICLVLDSNKNLVANGVTGAVAVTVDAVWKDGTFATNPDITAQKYWLCFLSQNSGAAVYTDFGGSSSSMYDSSNSYATPNNPTDGDYSGSSYHSIYATYTAGGGGNPVQPNHLMSLMGCGN